MKKVIVLLIIVLTTISLFGCAGNSAENVQETINPPNEEIIPSGYSAKAELPEQFVVSEYDKEYFRPATDDFIIVSYEIPINLYVTEWFNNLGSMSYGYAGSDKESTVKVTLMTCFDGEYNLGTKIRLEYVSTEEAMTAAVIRDNLIVPSQMGLPNKEDDSLVTAEYFEDSDRQLFGAFPSTMFNGYTAEYKGGHFDNLRYFEITSPENNTYFEYFWQNPPVAEHQNTGNVYVNLISYTAGEVLTVPRVIYQDELDGEGTMLLFSSKRSYSPPKAISNESDKAVLNDILSLSNDSEYLTPLTEDYIFVVGTYNENYDFKSGDPKESIVEQLVALYSYDADGNCVQECCRAFHRDYITDENFYATGLQINQNNTYYSKVVGDRENGAIYCEREMGKPDEYYATKTEMLEQLHGEAGGYYASKP